MYTYKCVYIYIYIYAAKSSQSCPTLCDPIDGSPPDSCPWDSPGKNTGVGCHFLLQCMKVKSESEVAQSCPTLHDPPWTVAYQAPPPMGYSRQEYWSGLPFPSPYIYVCVCVCVCVCVLVIQSCLTLCNPMNYSLQVPLSLGFYR